MIFEKGSKILFIGDSISDYERKRPVGEGLFNAWGTSYVSDVGALLGCMYPEMHYRVVNMGVSGNQARDLEARWQTDVFDQNPDWVCVLIGINDVWRQFDTPEIREGHVSPEAYEACYDGLIARTLPRVKGMVLMTPYFMEPNRSDPMRARMDQYGAVVKRLAEKYGAILVDVQSAFDDYFRFYHPASIQWDRIHPNIVGHTLIAREILKQLDYQW